MSNTAPKLVPAKIDIRVDRDMQRLFVTVEGDASGRDMATSLIRAYAEHPPVVRWDMLFDLRHYTGAVEAEHVKIIVAGYECHNPDPKIPCRTAFVTPDKNFRLWAAAMSFQFKGREHQAFETFEEAEAFLAPPMAERRVFEAVEPR